MRDKGVVEEEKGNTSPIECSWISLSVGDVQRWRGFGEEALEEWSVSWYL